MYGYELVPVKPADGERFGDFIQRLIIDHPMYSNQFRVSPGHTDGTGKSSVALLVPREVAEYLAGPKPDDDLISEKEVPPERLAAPVIEAVAEPEEMPVVEVAAVKEELPVADAVVEPEEPPVVEAVVPVKSPSAPRGRRRKSSASS